MKQFISAHDVPDIDSLVHIARAFKAQPLSDKRKGQGKRVGLLFMNPSLRTRLSTQIAAANLGMECIVFNIGNEGWQMELHEGAIMNGTTVEHIQDAAPVLGGYFDMLCVRSFPGLVNREDDYSELFVSQLIKYTGIPVVSLETATLHPLQSLADIISIEELTPVGRKLKVVLSWAPHIKATPQCVANSFAQWVNKWGKAEFVITHPEGYELDEQFTKGATIVPNQMEALEGADFVYVKNWSSYSDYGRVICEDSSWMPTNLHLAKTNDARFMHCLPVRRNVELSDELLNSTNSLVNMQATNRIYAAQAVFSEILNAL